MISTQAMNAYLNSPFNAQPNVGAQPRMESAPLFEAQPLPLPGAYAPDALRSPSDVASALDRTRMYALYGAPRTQFTYPNPADGAAITIAPDFVSARSHLGTSIVYDRKQKAYDFIEPTRSLAVLQDGTVRLKEGGNAVTGFPDGRVQIRTADGQTRMLLAETFDPAQDLVASKILSKDAASNFAAARKTKQIGTLEPVLRTFAPSSANALNTAQWIDAQRMQP